MSELDKHLPDELPVEFPEDSEAESPDQPDNYEADAAEFIAGAQGFRDRIRNVGLTKGDAMQVLATVGGCLLYKEHFQQQPPLADAFAIISAAGIYGMYVDAKYNNAEVIPQLPRRIATGLISACMLAFGPEIIEGAINQAKQVQLPDFRPGIESLGKSVGEQFQLAGHRIRENPRIVLVGMGAGTAVAGVRKIQREMQEHKPIRTAIARAVDYRKGATVKSDLRAIRRAGEVAWEHASYHASRLALIGIRNLSGYAARKFETFQSKLDSRIDSLAQPGHKK